MWSWWWSPYQQAAAEAYGAGGDYYKVLEQQLRIVTSIKHVELVVVTPPAGAGRILWSWW